MPFIYNYHPETRHYLWTSDAEYSPKEFNVILLPAHATLIEPPVCEKDQIVVFDEDSQSWKIIDRLLEDYQKEFYATDHIHEEIPKMSPEQKAQLEKDRAEFEKRKAAWEVLQEEKKEILLKLGLTKEEAEKLLIV